LKNIDVFCVFPEAVDAALRVGVVGRAIERGLVGYRSFDLRAFSPNGRIDDMPYGGGAGMVVRVDVVARAFEEVYGAPAREVRNARRVVLTEPAGRPLVQGYVDEVAAGPDLTVVCGRYGGVDERVWTGLATEAVSLGDFVLSGGEIVAAALADAVVRRLDGVLVGGRRPVVVELAEADPAWPDRFLVHAARIRAALGDAAQQLEHVGSTAVPGLAAKPVVDVQLVVPDLDAAVAALVAAGYPLRVREPGHRVVQAPPPDAANVHLHEVGDPQLADRLRLRDRLRAEPEARRSYEEVKRSLADRLWPDVNHYAEAKGPVIRRLLAGE